MKDDRTPYDLSDFYLRVMRARQFGYFGYSPERTGVSSDLTNLAHALVTAPHKYETLIGIIREETEGSYPLLYSALDALVDAFAETFTGRAPPTTPGDLYSVAEALLAKKEDAPFLAARALAGALETERLRVLSIRNATGGPSRPSDLPYVQAIRNGTGWPSRPSRRR